MLGQKEEKASYILVHIVVLLWFSCQVCLSLCNPMAWQLKAHQIVPLQSSCFCCLFLIAMTISYLSH